ncbi:hypothetical protein [Crocosphaera sp. Alani8]|uniref:hypothetical protein n=1 Tax=Crocosphaera sp. Alani8 TaxID=3038952 RepID=UPI00313D326A
MFRVLNYNPDPKPNQGYSQYSSYFQQRSLLKVENLSTLKHQRREETVKGRSLQNLVS